MTNSDEDSCSNVNDRPIASTPITTANTDNPNENQPSGYFEEEDLYYESSDTTDDSLEAKAELCKHNFDISTSNNYFANS